MTLEKYIQDLLYRYDCVIVPNFGAFIANSKSAQVNNQKFEPPYKQITFNSLIQNNDGLLANHIAQTDKMPYETALNFIQFEVEEWVEKLLDNELVLKGIGTFYLVDDTIHFEPNTQTNYLTDAFGLSTFNSNVISRQETITLQDNPSTYKKQVEELEEKTPIYINQEKRKKSSYFLKYAAIFLLGGAVIGLLGKKMYDENKSKQQVIALQNQQKINENKIQTATFVIDSPLPTITVHTVEPKIKYFIIAGAFRNEQNAQNKVAQLIKKGYKASVVGKNKWNLTQVAFGSFSSLEKANMSLQKIKTSVAKDAWLLVK